MQPTDQEITRRLLESIIKRIEGGDQSAQRLTDGLSKYTSLHNADPGIVLVVIQSHGAEFGTVEEARIQSGYAMAGKEGIGRNAGSSLHPGFEKFPLPESASEETDARRCFMEPDRVCVNSGACEMRGY